MGLNPNLYNPCLYSGFIQDPSNKSDMPSHLPIIVGLYVNDFVFFSEDSAVESKFLRIISSLIPAVFIGTVGWFLGVHFTWDKLDNPLSVHLNQAGFAQNLVESFNRQDKLLTPQSTPYRSGLPIDAILGHNPKDISPAQL